MDRLELNINEFMEWVDNNRNARFYKDTIENIIHDFLKERENRSEPKLSVTVDGESIRKVIEEKVEEAFISFGVVEEEADVEKELAITKSNILIAIAEMVRSGRPEDISRARELADMYRNISR